MTASSQDRGPLRPLGVVGAVPAVTGGQGTGAASGRSLLRPSGRSPKAADRSGLAGGDWWVGSDQDAEPAPREHHDVGRNAGRPWTTARR